MLPFRRILVALPRDDVDRELMQYTGMLTASGSGLEVQFVHILGRGESHAGALRQMVDDVANCLPAKTQSVSCHVLNGARVDLLLEFAAEQSTDLVVVGHRRNRSGRRSMARRLAMKAPCSLLLVPEGAPARLDRIMAAVDYSPASALALSVAAALASHHGLSRCHALHVFFEDAPSGTATGGEGRRLREFSEFASPLDLHDVEVRPIFAEGASVSPTIQRVAAADQADLIVMGTRGRSPAAAVLLGSESEQTLTESPIPVLVVKHRGERVGLLEILLDRDLRSRPAPRFN